MAVDEEEKGEVHFDDVLKELGDFGRFQCISYFLICISTVFSGANYMSCAFTAGVAKYDCVDPKCDNGTSFKNKTCDKYVRIDTPSVSDTWKLESCKELNWKLTAISNFQFGFIVIGCFIFGVLSDRYGRKQMFLISTLLMFFGGVSHVITTNFFAYLAITVIYGIGISGVYPLGFVLGMEMVGKSKRELAGTVLNLFFSAGSVLLGLTAYYFQPNWKHIQMIVSGPVILFVVYFFYLPESVRWLMAKGKVQETFYIITKASKVNKVVLSNNTLDRIKNISKNTEVNVQQSTGKIRHELRKIIKSKKLVLRYLIVFFLWISIGYIYQAMLFNAMNMVGNPYLNFALISLMDIPAYGVSWIAIYKLGRKYPLLFCMAVGLVGSGILIFINKEMKWVRMGIQLTVKLFITAAFQIIYVYTAEIYPTTIRSMGVTSNSTLGKLGGFVSSFTPIIGTYVRSLPGIIDTVLSVISVIGILRIPETKHIKLPNTVEEAMEI